MHSGVGKPWAWMAAPPFFSGSHGACFFVLVP